MSPQQIYQQNNALIGQYGQKAGEFGTQYSADSVQAHQANQDLANYRANMQDLGQAYGQNVKNVQQQYGFDPSQLKSAQQALASTQTTLANLPQAVQQSANGRMLTGAQMANRYSQTAGNIQGVLAGQGNAVNALQSTLQNSLNQAGQQTSFLGQSQQMNLGALQNVYQNAVAQQQQASALLQHYNSLQQQGVQLNVQEQQAQASAAAAAAQAQQAQAAIMQATQQGRLIDAQLAGLQQPQSLQQRLTSSGISPAQQASIRNYQSNPGIQSWTQAAKTGSPLEGIGHVLKGLFTGSF